MDTLLTQNGDDLVFEYIPGAQDEITLTSRQVDDLTSVSFMESYKLNSREGLLAKRPRESGSAHEL